MKSNRPRGMLPVKRMANHETKASTPRTSWSTYRTTKWGMARNQWISGRQRATSRGESRSSWTGYPDALAMTLSPRRPSSRPPPARIVPPTADVGSGDPPHRADELMVGGEQAGDREAPRHQGREGAASHEHVHHHHL